MTALHYDDRTIRLPRPLELHGSPALRLQPSPAPRLRPVGPLGPERPVRPPFVVLPGGVPAARYRRRRLAVAAVASLLVVLAALGLRWAGGDLSPTSADAPGAAGVAAPATYVVRAGDTLWSIAGAIAPEADVRVTVDRLVRLNGPAPLVPGQELELP